jgi:hypothetical protein
MADDRPFVVHSATKITLKPDALDWAREWGMTDVQMAKWLLARNQAGEDFVPESDIRYGEEE